MKKLVIALDGPVGAGKSTVADEVAKRLNILHLDTGAMYRAMGLYALQCGADPDDENAVSALCDDALIDVTYIDGVQHTHLNGKDVTAFIRTQEVGTAASKVSRWPRVRRMLVDTQRRIASAQSVLLDGRDIGTVVLPDAKLKIYITASGEKRAERRMKQLSENGTEIAFADVLREVLSRDEQDMNRKADPLRKADDAVLLDTSDIDFEQTVQAILRLVEDKYGN